MFIKHWRAVSFSFSFALLSSQALASPIFEMNTSVRALGMGNAYMGVVKDADSLFYNAAGLARVRGLNWLVLDPQIGVSGYEALEDIKHLRESSGFEGAVNSLYGEHVSAAVGAKSIVTLPYFGVGVYNSLNAGLDVNNPVYPNLDVNATNDFGYVLGFAVPVSSNFHVGAVVKRVKRIGSRMPVGPSFVATLDPDRIKDQVMKEGRAYGLDLGANLIIPTAGFETILSAIWKDVGQTSFKTGSTAEAPPAQEQEISIGVALNIDAPLISISPALDVKHLNRDDVQLGKKVHMGIEIGLPLIDLRAGLYQGYYTAGAGVNLGLLRVDAATYGVELGEYPGQQEDRRYVLQLSMELGFNPDFKFMGGGSGGGGSRSAKRVKQRR